MNPAMGVLCYDVEWPEEILFFEISDRRYINKAGLSCPLPS
jgi:hypothetical protein